MKGLMAWLAFISASRRMYNASWGLRPGMGVVMGMERWASSSLRSMPAEASASASSLVSVAFGGCPPLPPAGAWCEGGGGGSMADIVL